MNASATGLTCCRLQNSASPTPVSYTHLDVYKRQALDVLCIFGGSWRHLAGNSSANGRADGQVVWNPLPGNSFGLTLFSHQIGGFLGAWLGGLAVVNLGSYEWMWWADAGLALAAAFVNLPIKEARPIPSRLVST